VGWKEENDGGDGAGGNGRRGILGAGSSGGRVGYHDIPIVRSVEVDPRAIEVETAGLERQEGPGGAGDGRDRLGQACEPIVEPGLVISGTGYFQKNEKTNQIGRKLLYMMRASS